MKLLLKVSNPTRGMSLSIANIGCVLVIIMRLLQYFIMTGAISMALFATDWLTVFFNPTHRLSVDQGNILTRVKSLNGKSFRLSSGESILLPASPFISPTLAKRSIIAEERAFFPFKNFNKDRLLFYNMLFKYSSFTGTKYYSKSDAKILTYIIESRRIASPNNPTVLSDPVYSNIKNTRVSFFSIHDNRFGEIIFKSEVSAHDNIFIVSNTNANTLSKWGITIAEQGSYSIIVVYIYNEEKKGFYYYCVHALDAKNSASLLNALFDPESFANRIRAETIKRASLLGLDWSVKLRPK